MGFSMYEFRDLDIMGKLDELGSVSSKDLLTELGLDGDRGTRAGVRLAWMKKFGMVVYDPETALWMLSEGGDRVLAAKRQAAGLTQLDGVPDEAMVDVMAHVTARYRHGDALVAHLLRREFLFGTARR
jgi:hypothetical protein